MLKVPKIPDIPEEERTDGVVELPEVVCYLMEIIQSHYFEKNLVNNL